MSATAPIPLIAQPAAAEPATKAATAMVDTAISSIIPSGIPDSNALIVFGLLLAFGVLGGLLAARAKWLPSITGFLVLGMTIGPSGLGLLTADALVNSRILVDIALGLILFRLGVTLHPVKAARNRKLVLTSLAESIGTFVAIVALMLVIGTPAMVAVLVGAIAVSSSPSVLIHVTAELKASGPTIRNAETLVAANNVLSFILFSLALPIALVGQSFSLGASLILPAYQMFGAVIISVFVAWLVTSIARLTRADEEHFRFALVVGAVMLTLGLSQAFKVSALFAGLSLGMACRWLQGRTRLTRVEFGGGGDVFFVILFVFAGANLHLKELLLYGPIALAFVAARALTKVGAVYGCGVLFGQTRQRSIAEGLMLVPMAGLAIGLVQTTNQLLPEMGARVAAIVLAAVAVFETIGPPLTAWAIRFSGEAGGAARTAANAHAAADDHSPATSVKG